MLSANDLTRSGPPVLLLGRDLPGDQRPPPAEDAALPV